MTGTIGGEASRKIFKQVYQSDTLIMPSFMKQRRKKLPLKLKPDEVAWIEEILQQALFEASKKKGVLIICLTIEIALILEA